MISTYLQMIRFYRVLFARAIDNGFINVNFFGHGNAHHFIFFTPISESCFEVGKHNFPLNNDILHYSALVL